MTDNLKAQLEAYCAVKEFPISFDSLDSVNAIMQCRQAFSQLPLFASKDGKDVPIIYEMKSDLSLLYTLREYLLGELNLPEDKPLVDIDLNELGWVVSKYTEFCNKLPADLQLDLLKSLDNEMFAYSAQPVKHLIKIEIPSNYKEYQSVIGFKFYLDDITKPETVRFKIDDIPYVPTKSFLCGGTKDDTLRKYSDMTEKFYRITRELIMESNLYPTIRNTLFWEEDGREVAFVISDVDIDFKVKKTPMINGAYSTQCKVDYKDAFMWLNGTIFFGGEQYPQKVHRFDKKLVDAFLFSALPASEGLYDFTDYYSVGAMRQQEAFYHDVSDKVDVKEAFRLKAMSYFGGHHPTDVLNNIDIVSLMRG